jgi:hypothetical protein
MFENACRPVKTVTSVSDQIVRISLLNAIEREFVARRGSRRNAAARSSPPSRPRAGGAGTTAFARVISGSSASCAGSTPNYYNRKKAQKKKHNAAPGTQPDRRHLRHAPRPPRLPSPTARPSLSRLDNPIETPPVIRDRAHEWTDIDPPHPGPQAGCAADAAPAASNGPSGPRLTARDRSLAGDCPTFGVLISSTVAGANADDQGWGGPTHLGAPCPIRG